MKRRDDLTFSHAEYERRVGAVRRRIAERGLDALMVTAPENLTYLTGYQTTGYYYFQALVLPLESEPFMVTRLLEDTNVWARTWLEVSRPYGDTEDAVGRLASAIEEMGLGRARIGYDEGDYFFRATEQRALREALPSAKLLPRPGIVEAERLVKSDEEIAVMERAARAAEAGMDAAIEATRAGATENDVAAELHRAMYAAGGEYVACPPFVVSGPRAAIGHATWEGRTIGEGEFVFLEIGGCVQRYHTAMMRTLYVGTPEDVVHEAEAIVRRALEGCMEAMRPGVRAREVDAVSREIIGQNRFGATQVTRSGYSIGIAYSPDWGEGQILSLQADEDRELEPNMTFHLIPWIQIPGRASVGISETVRVTKDGCEPLTRFDRRVFLC